MLRRVFQLAACVRVCMCTLPGTTNDNGTLLGTISNNIDLEINSNIKKMLF